MYTCMCIYYVYIYIHAQKAESCVAFQQPLFHAVTFGCLYYVTESHALKVQVLELPLYAARTDYGFEYVLPSKMRSFMANRNLVLRSISGAFSQSNAGA